MLRTWPYRGTFCDFVLSRGFLEYEMGISMQALFSVGVSRVITLISKLVQSRKESIVLPVESVTFWKTIVNFAIFAMHAFDG